jgi:hypothetical protein
MILTPKNSRHGGVAVKVLVVYYSMFGHVHRLAEAVDAGAAGARFQGRYVALVASKITPHRDAIIASLAR